MKNVKIFVKEVLSYLGLHIKLKEPDGTLNGTTIVSLASAVILFLEAVCQALDIVPLVKFDDLTGFANIVLAFLVSVGVVTNVSGNPKITDKKEKE